MTVLIVDDHSGFRSWTRSLLETEGFDVIGEAGDGRSAIDRVHELRPDLVLVDVMLPDTTGFAVATAIAALDRPPSVILVSSREAHDFGDVLGHAHALGFISKSDLSGASLRSLLDPDR
jgi:DNA-binding NarL/FixJ family response regulator